MKMLDQAIYRNKVSQESFRDKKGNDRNKQPPLKKVLEEEDFAANYREIFKGKQKMYHTAFIIIFFGKSEDELRAAESHVKVILESNRVYYEAPDYRQLDTFLSAQPFPFRPSTNVRVTKQQSISGVFHSYNRLIQKILSASFTVSDCCLVTRMFVLPQIGYHSL
ncbi:MAG TPA: hypothetical protein VF298_04390 [Bacteroidales bacterium]|jgi:hypothetical protein